MRIGFAFKIAVISLAILIAVIASELVARLTITQPENLAKLKSSSFFLYENKPNAIFSTYGKGEFENEISINSFGFRDDEFSKEKMANVYRIAVLGDSQEEALQVPLADTWQKVMAQKLSQELRRNVETYNFGISGYGTDQEWLTLREKVWQFLPDMVVLAFSPNDVGDTYKNKLIRLEDDRLKVVSAKERAGGNILGKLIRQTYLYHLILKASSRSGLAKGIVDKIRTKILGFPKDERFFLSDAQLVQGPFEVIASQKNPPNEVLETWKVVLALISDMKRQTDLHQAKFLITINIPGDQVKESNWKLLQEQYKLDPNSSSPYEINEKMAEIAKDVGVDFYDPREDAISWREKTGELHLPKDGHFNKNGHLFMGTKVAEFILDNELLPFGKAVVDSGD